MRKIVVLFISSFGLLVGACSTSDPITGSTVATSVVTSTSPTTPPPTTTTVVPASWAPSPLTTDGISSVAFTEAGRFAVRTKGGEFDFLAGINLGATVPNHSPGELAVTAEDYRRWFPQMAELGFRVIRIYTIHPPAFYEELAAFNTANPDGPLYLMHGAWIPELEYLESRDLFAPAVRDGFRSELSDVVSVVFGNAEIAEGLGHASGIYTTDVSDWVIGWIIGIEWDPEATFESDEANEDRPKYQGEFFTADEAASATESWLAEMLDVVATDLMERGKVAPLAFANWPTTDPLVHPDEPLDKEDMLGVDANHVRPTGAWPGGYFASYHAYPYYPDFQRFEPGIADFEYNGSVDPYAGYLTALVRHHGDIPVLITEFGVPSSAGSAHIGPLGRDQGGHSEQVALAINAELLEVIEGSGAFAGLYFEWLDEWFKFTWNTIDYERPSDRRSLWMNPWTNEAHFGLVAVEPESKPPVVIDGDDGEWSTNESQVIYENSAGVREVRARKDAGYLYLRLVLDTDDGLDTTALTLGFDVIDGDSGGLPGTDGVDPTTDYAVTLGSGDHGQIWVRPSNDPYVLPYGVHRSFFEFDLDSIEEGSGAWNPQRLILNRPYVVPTTGEERLVEFQETGSLIRGTSDPESPLFDSRAAWEADERVVELRLPWQGIGVSDPSSLQAYTVDIEGSIGTETFDRIEISVLFDGELHRTAGYAWEGWQRYDWHERPKVGLDVFADQVRRLNGLTADEG